MVVLYQVYIGEFADEKGKKPIVIPNIKISPKNMSLTCEAVSDEDLVMFFQDKLFAKNDKYYLGDMSGVDEEIRSKLEGILNMDEDRRAREHLEFEDGTKEKLRKRRPRNYILYDSGKRL